MMALAVRAPANLRGRLTKAAPIAPRTWFRVGGPADLLFQPADVEDLAAFLEARPDGAAVTVLGVASNLLVRDGGVRGTVVRLGGRAFGTVTIEGTRVRAGAGALDSNVALSCRDAGVAGLEFLSGIPGTIGGNLRMNAGAYGTEIKDRLVEAVALDGRGRRRVLPTAELGLAYRHCGVPADWIFVEAVFEGTPDEPARIAARMAEIEAQREASQPVRARTGGSTFANPPGDKAWRLIDAAGCRGLRRGGAMVSEKHANFLVNLGDATAADLEDLGEEVRARVKETSGVSLFWEVKRIGERPS